jgi:hypothetical protein
MFLRGGIHIPVDLGDTEDMAIVFALQIEEEE